MKQFINSIANAIKTYNPGIDTVRAKALAKSGIIDPDYIPLSERKMNLAERETTDTLTNGKYKGTKCP